ncbi:MAG TPA: hypothetical protein ENJ20_01715, partial [Bacteroidetes bacterium]|nr:hypothetical protein [Bacteroidota bacterium]
MKTSIQTGTSTSISSCILKNMRLIKKGYWILAMVVFTGWQSCVPDNKDKDVVIQVDDEYTINMVESLSNNRQLFFELESIDMEPCLNSSIDRAVVVEEGKISLFINGIVAAVDCTPGMAPATSTGNAGTLQNGIYDFVITIRNTIENRGKLIVRNDDYEINMITENGIIILH